MGNDWASHSITISGVDVTVIVREWKSISSEAGRRSVKVVRGDNEDGKYILAMSNEEAKRGPASFLKPSSRSLMPRDEHINNTLKEAREELEGSQSNDLAEDTRRAAETFEDLDNMGV